MVDKDPEWREQKTVYQVYETAGGELAYRFKEQEVLLGEVVRYDESPLRQAALDVTQRPARGLRRLQPRVSSSLSRYGLSGR